MIPINDLLAVLRALPSYGRSTRLFPNDPNDDSAGPLDGDEFDPPVWRVALVRTGLTKATETRETKRVCAGTGRRVVEKVRRQVARTFRW